LSSEDNSSEITSFSDFFASELFDNQSNNTQTSNTSTNEKISTGMTLHTILPVKMMPEKQRLKIFFLILFCSKTSFQPIYR
jgi:hypothetical protein